MGRFIREIKFVTTGQLAAALGVTKKRVEELDTFVGAILNRGGSIKEVLTALNDRQDLNDSEWTAAVYALGHLCGRIGK